MGLVGKPFTKEPKFHSLSIKDLLEIRDAYHVHLANLENVVGTAIGRYLIRDLKGTRKGFQPDGEPKHKTPRTLGNCSVQKWSWPCILVFVDKWVPYNQFAERPAEYIPPRLYLPDGRVAPTCVIYSPRAEYTALTPVQPTFPTGLLGGGYPILTETQGQVRVGSVGGLVTDGINTYALTSRHVVGEEGAQGLTLDRGQRRPVAISYKRSEDKVALSDAYPGWPGHRTLVNLDSGLFKVNDLSEWTAQVYGLGRIGPLLNLNVDTLSLDLIGCPVRAFGGASGDMRGQVLALFYRYRSVGGYDYVAEVLVGPRAGQQSVDTRPGDSGTFWFWDEDAEKDVPQDKGRTKEYRPIAIQWGGHSVLEQGGQGVRNFALASLLATVCRRLDVEIIRDWSIEHSAYWGKVGHYKIAFSACALLSSKKLAALIQANATNISYSDDTIQERKLPRSVSRDQFTPLADVPDLVWRITRKRDQANHFADMDEPGQDKRTLLGLWFKRPQSRSPQEWGKFYDGLEKPPADRHRGALPFRVWQLYEAMVGFVKNRDIARYVCASGVLAHYVGDACQPLHVSFLHHGDPDNEEEKPVHSVYETKMLDRFSVEVVDAVNKRLKGVKVKRKGLIKGGAEAADLVVKLMRTTISHLPPQEVVNAFNENRGRGQVQAMWEELGGKTVGCMAMGAQCLATIWESAWIEGDGDKNIPSQALGTVDKKKLMTIYNDPKFVEPKWLKDMKL